MEQGYYEKIETPREALYEAACALDNQDVPLEDWPVKLIAALARAGFAVVPVELPHDALGRAAIAGVAETGNPKHAWDFPDRRVIPHGDWRTIVADPPWRIDLNRKTPHPAKGSAFGTHVPQLAYPTMSDADIEALCPPAADAAHLYLWTVNAKVEAAYKVARAWGFRPSSLLVWAKNPMGVGLGGTYCNTTEFCLFARRGTLPAMRRVPTTWWNWKRGKHSVKPDAFQEMVETVSPGPYLELFARRRRDGWEAWGNEV